MGVFIIFCVFLILINSLNISLGVKVIQKNIIEPHPYGRGIQVFGYENREKEMVDFDIIDHLLLKEEVKDRKIVTISIIGEPRKGKSFFLNYCLRFLYANVSILLQ